MIVKLTDEKNYQIEWDLAKQVIREMKGIPVVIGRLESTLMQAEAELTNVTDEEASGISLQLETGISP